MPLDYNYEIILNLSKVLAKLSKSSKFLDYLEENYPFTDKTYREALKIIDKDFKNLYIEVFF